MSKHAVAKYTSIGSYPLLMVRKNTAYCPACANKLDVATGDVVDVNWENHELYCDECGERIESAYAEHLVAKEKTT